ncbi:MAG TPA: hypothetical protein ENI23_17885 [bacterium]|nr:hypothetical protein [bacterium]
MHYYDWKGKPYTGTRKEQVLKWGKDFESKKHKIIKQQTLWWGGWVSTVWLGLDHQFGFGKPLIFESMIFFKSWSDLGMDRYSTRRGAFKGHRAMVRKWSNPLVFVPALMDRLIRRIRYGH